MMLRIPCQMSLAQLHPVPLRAIDESEMDLYKESGSVCVLSSQQVCTLTKYLPPFHSSLFV